MSHVGDVLAAERSTLSPVITQRRDGLVFAVLRGHITLSSLLTFMGCKVWALLVVCAVSLGREQIPHHVKLLSQDQMHLAPS